MAADVSSLLRIMNAVDGKESAKSTAPITRDLLGGCCTLDSKELDLDLQVPCGWEKRLDLKSGKVYLQRNCNPASKFQDLNYPPASCKPTLNLFNDSSLDLKLQSAISPSPSSNYQSVCTLDKVKSALERAEKKKLGKRASSRSPSNSSSSNDGGDVEEDEKTTSFAAGCPSCLMYVLISKSKPRCPRCFNEVPIPAATVKKPRIDLNISI